MGLIVSYLSPVLKFSDSFSRKREISSEPNHPADLLRDTCQIISSDVLKDKSESVDSRNLQGKLDSQLVFRFHTSLLWH